MAVVETSVVYVTCDRCDCRAWADVPAVWPDAEQARAALETDWQPKGAGWLWTGTEVLCPSCRRYERPSRPCRHEWKLPSSRSRVAVCDLCGERSRVK